MNRYIPIAVLLVCLLAPCQNAMALESVVATHSECIKSLASEGKGSGKRPYNFRAIDGRLFAGGTLFNPETGSNSDELVRRYLRDLRAMGVKTVITLHMPAATDRKTRALERLCREEGLTWFPCRMTGEQVPDAKQTAALLSAIDAGAYVHCQWGCDRTGAVIAK
ncbi:MAG TPA: hypothetical protein PKM25_04060, partial [Candidatus Ozemobacteraceae bacterium]|nr:hypothetical protein [Candidatus Ozemobacteraceae bacterium]